MSIKILACFVLSLATTLFAEPDSLDIVVNISGVKGKVALAGSALKNGNSLNLKIGPEYDLVFDEAEDGAVLCSVCAGKADIMVKETVTTIGPNGPEGDTSAEPRNVGPSAGFFSMAKPEPTGGGGDPDPEPSDPGEVFTLVKKSYKISFAKPAAQPEMANLLARGSAPSMLTASQEPFVSDRPLIGSGTSCCSSGLSTSPSVSSVAATAHPEEVSAPRAHFELPLGGYLEEGEKHAMPFGSLVFDASLLENPDFSEDWQTLLSFRGEAGQSHVSHFLSDPVGEFHIYKTPNYVFKATEEDDIISIKQYSGEFFDESSFDVVAEAEPLIAYYIKKVGSTFEFKQFKGSDLNPSMTLIYEETFVANTVSTVKWTWTESGVKQQEVNSRFVNTSPGGSPSGEVFADALISETKETYEFKTGGIVKQLTRYHQTQHEVFRYQLSGDRFIKLNYEISGVGLAQRKNEYWYRANSDYIVTKTYQGSSLNELVGTQVNRPTDEVIEPWLSTDVTSSTGGRILRKDTGELVHFTPGGAQDYQLYWPSSGDEKSLYTSRNVMDPWASSYVAADGTAAPNGAIRERVYKINILGLPSSCKKLGINFYHPVMPSAIGGHYSIVGTEPLSPPYGSPNDTSIPGELAAQINSLGAVTQYTLEEPFTSEDETLYPVEGGPYTTESVLHDVKGAINTDSSGLPIYEGSFKQTGKSYRVKKVSGPYGVVSETTEVWDGTEWQTMTFKYYTYSSAGKLLSITQDGITIESREYPTDLSETVTDSMGVSTTRTENTAGRLLSVKRVGAPASTWPAQSDILTSYSETYSAPSNEVTTIHRSETTSSAGLSLSQHSGSEIGGTTLYETNEAGIRTDYLYGLNGSLLTETASRASGDHTLVTSRYFDGRIRELSGTGQVRKRYSYAVTASGIQETEELLDPSSTVIATNTRLRSGDGDLLSETVDGVTTTYTYDEACQLVRKSVTGQANYLYHYDYRGFADKEGYDINGDNVLTPGSTDIITERERYYELDAGDWWLVNKVSRYVTDGNGTQKLTTTSREKQNIAAGWVTQTLSPDGEMEQTTRTRSGKTVTSATTSTRYPGRTQTQVLYNGRLVSSQSFSQSQPVTYLYDALGRQTTVTDHGTGESQTTAYSPTTGQVISQTNGAMESTSYGYYANTHVNAGQVNWIQNSAGLRTYYAYNTMGLQTHQWGAAAQPVRYNYDGLGRLLSLDTYSTQTPSLWSVSSLPTSSFNSGYSRRDFVMSNNRLSSRTYGPGSGSVSYLYQTDGSLDTRTWGGAGGGVTDYAYDTAGRTTGIDYSDSTPDVSATYDRAGRLSTLTDAAGSHTFAHEANGDVVETVTSGLLNGLTLTKTSDVSGQVATLEWSFAGVSQKAAYTYDSQKRLETANLGPVTGDPLVTATYGYHSGSQRVHTLTRPIATGDNFVGTYTQDLVGRLDTLIWQRGATVHGSYDYDLDTAGRRDKETRHDGTWLDYGYNDRGELTSAARKRTSDNSTRQDWSHLYTYDDAGNPSTTGNPEGQTLLHAQSASGSNYNRTITAAQKRWLRGVAHPNAVVKVDGQTASREGSQWRYLLVNPAPPAAQRTQVVASRPDRSPEPVPVYQTLTLPASPSTWVFNERGNLTSDAQWTYTWDMENRLIVQEQKFPGITGDGPQPVKRLEFSYDAKGRRIAKRVFTNQRQSNGDLVNGSWTFVQETVFLWQDWTLLAEFVRSSPSGSFGLRRSYLWGLDVDGTFGGAGGVGGLLWVAEYVPGQSSSHRQLAPWYDGNGNIMGWLEKDGSQSLPLYRLEYDPYGKLLVEETVRVERNQKQRDLNVGAEWLTRPPFAFSTKYEDAESGLLYYGYRYYAPEMQRWLSRDPIGEDGGLNLYGMVGNDAVNGLDYLGLADQRLRDWPGDCDKLRQFLSNGADAFADLIKKLGNDIDWSKRGRSRFQNPQAGVKGDISRHPNPSGTLEYIRKKGWEDWRNYRNEAKNSCKKAENILKLLAECCLTPISPEIREHIINQITKVVGGMCKDPHFPEAAPEPYPEPTPTPSSPKVPVPSPEGSWWRYFNIPLS